tara:strand:+ start:1043 stop:1219 length:177 start_codon:yes stop_codon:yes gene_type:complete
MEYNEMHETRELLEACYNALSNKEKTLKARVEIRIRELTIEIDKYDLWIESKVRENNT